jgi:hypothetical protein
MIVSCYESIVSAGTTVVQVYDLYIYNV